MLELFEKSQSRKISKGHGLRNYGTENTAHDTTSDDTI